MKSFANNSIFRLQVCQIREKMSCSIWWDVYQNLYWVQQKTWRIWRFGSLGRNKLKAHHALIFYLRGLNSGYKRWIKTTWKNIEIVLDMVINIGVHPKALICDQWTNNFSAVHYLGALTNKPFFLETPKLSIYLTFLFSLSYWQ